MKGINKVILVGHLGQDPEVRYLANGDAVANFSLATSESWKDKQTGERVERTEWHRIVFFQRLAEIASEYLKKGSAVYVEGKLQTRKWQDKDGNDRYTTEVRGLEMSMLGGRDSGEQDRPAQKAQGFRDRGATQSAAPARKEIEQEDIPF